MFRRILPLVLLGLLSACGSGPRPVPAPVVNEPAADALTAGFYRVQAGDTIYSVARELHLSVRSLIDANQLQAPYQLVAGQRLALPGAGFYLVAKGDSLSVIARKTGVPFGTLARMNGLSAPYVLQVGQKLQMPANGVAALPPAPAPAAPAMPPAPVTVAALPPLVPASRPSVTSTPVPPPPYPAIVPPAPPVAAAGPAAAASVPPPVPPPAPALPATVTPAVIPVPLPTPPAKSGRGFVWPVKGEVIAEFGTTGKGQHNDGINIAAPRGTPVIAAESGVVAYAGNELRGFGNLLLIKHEDKWMTAYAHNDQLLVKRGDVVRRGQKIALVGDSGGVSQPQLHFEIRQGNRAIDPEPILAGKPLPAPGSLDPPDPG